MKEALGSIHKLGMEVHVYISSSGIESRRISSLKSFLATEFQASMDYLTPCLKAKTQNKWKKEQK